MNDYELMHYGVKGMKWGVRKKQPTFERDGSAKTMKRLNALLDADKKYGPNRTARQDRKIHKLHAKYDKSAKKDIKKAIKANDDKAAKSISAGRTYLKMIVDSNYLSSAITDASIHANVPVGKNFTYNVLRDDSVGGVKITVNGVSNDYIYAPEAKRQ